MTRRDFEAIARALRDEKPNYSPLGVELSYDQMTDWQRGAYDLWSTTTLALARVLKASNSAFDQERFLRACGVV